MVGGRRSSGAKLLLTAIVFFLGSSCLSSSSLPLFEDLSHSPIQSPDRVRTDNLSISSPLPSVHRVRCRYVEVDEANGVRLVCYFTPSERSPADDPIMLWLSGGPGCSSFNGLIWQIGTYISMLNIMIKRTGG